MAINHLRSVPAKKANLKTIGEAGADFFTSKESKPVLARVAAILDHVPAPAALWSQDRRWCVFNDLARQLLGFCEHDFGPTGSLWIEQVHPDDREICLTTWKQLQNGEPKISCQYRFLPKHRAHEVDLRESAFLYHPREIAVPVVWSFYSDHTPIEKETADTRQLRELLVGLTHEIGNSLQAISGELDLLRLMGTLPQQSSTSIAQGVQQIRKLTREISEYLAPAPQELKSEDLAVLLTEVIRASERELAEQGIHMTVVVKEPLPRLRLDGQFRSALKRVIDFSCALLPQGGELKIEAGLYWREGDQYVELSLINASPTSLSVKPNDVFRPFLKVNECRVGLSMAVAREILRRHFGKIAFHQEHRNRGVFSILIKVPSDNGH
jgi:nitrogen-specific signal transduction histidine kinase